MTGTPEDTARWRELLSADRLPAFALIMLGVWLQAADALVTTTIMPSVGADLDGYAWFGWATSGYLVGVVVAGACAGWLADRIGLRRAMVGSGLLLAAGCAMSAAGPGIGFFIAGRVIQGIGAGWVLGFCFVTIHVVFPERFLVRIFAAATAIWGVATFIGPLIGGLFADGGAWRGVFWLFAVQALLFAWATIHLVPAHGGEQGGRVPFFQLIIITLGIVLLSSAGVVTAAWLQWTLVPAGVVLLTLALIVDRKAESRLFPRQAGNFGSLIGAAYATYFATMAGAIGFSIYAPAILQFTNGLSALEAGYVVAIEAAVWTVAALLVAGSGPQWRRRWIVIGTLLIPMGLLLLAFFLASGDLPLVLLGGAMMGGGFGLYSSFANRLVMANLDEHEGATGSGGIAAMRNAGGAAGAAIVGIAANVTGFADGPNAQSVAAAGFWVCAIGVPFGLIGALAAMRLVALARAEQSGAAVKS
ncbi:MFS transporter [Parasphingopyxis marina]|nr:MFS transporter [Parasphingopyxis marina]